MKSTAELNWLVKLEDGQGLDGRVLRIGDSYEFAATGHRVYPIDTPIHLVNDDWTAVASIMVREFTVGYGKTKGVYEVLRLYGKAEQQVISQNMIPE